MELHADGRPILRYSLFDAWWSNPEKAMARYFTNTSDDISTKWMAFGSLVADALLERPVPEWCAGIKHYDVNEHRIISDIDGFLIRSTIDSFDFTRKKFLDNKCCKAERKKREDGWTAHTWTDNKVKKWKQLDFYSMHIQQHYGSVDEECHISVVPVYEDENGLVRRTGEPSIEIPRIITQLERDHMRERVVTTAKEIIRMYDEYKNGMLPWIQ